MAESIPAHLSPFLVEQPYENYTAIDHAVWRYVMRQNVAFHRGHAHSIYLEGLAAAGISVEEIPEITRMSEALAAFGWRAVAVDGFIPPAAFMEFQARGILPIAYDMRTMEHVSYTPAPDIIHESAGHAPILRDERFAVYVRTICELGRQALSTPEDDQLYEAIRHLSIVKETPTATPDEIREAEERLTRCQEAIGTVSEANMVSRLYWWTVEYGLIGDLSNPKIYGAGLLSSVGESQRVYTDAVKKIPFDLDVCISTSYDITSYQPQLFVCESFEQLTEAVHVLAKRLGLSLERLDQQVEEAWTPPRVSTRSSQATPSKAYPAALVGLYQELRDLRAGTLGASERESRLLALRDGMARFPEDWLIRLEWLEAASSAGVLSQDQDRVRSELERLRTDADRRELIDNGLALLGPSVASSRS